MASLYHDTMLLNESLARQKEPISNHLSWHVVVSEAVTVRLLARVVIHLSPLALILVSLSAVSVRMLWHGLELGVSLQQMAICLVLRHAHLLEVLVLLTQVRSAQALRLEDRLIFTVLVEVLGDLFRFDFVREAVELVDVLVAFGLVLHLNLAVRLFELL